MPKCTQGALGHRSEELTTCGILRHESYSTCGKEAVRRILYADGRYI